MENKQSYELVLEEYRTILTSLKHNLNPLKNSLINDISMSMYALNYSPNKEIYDTLLREKISQFILLNQLSELKKSNSLMK